MLSVSLFKTAKVAIGIIAVFIVSEPNSAEATAVIDTAINIDRVRVAFVDITRMSKKAAIRAVTAVLVRISQIAAVNNENPLAASIRCDDAVVPTPEINTVTCRFAWIRLGADSKGQNPNECDRNRVD